MVNLNGDLTKKYGGTHPNINNAPFKLNDFKSLPLNKRSIDILES